MRGLQLLWHKDTLKLCGARSTAAGAASHSYAAAHSECSVHMRPSISMVVQAPA